ncbi:Ankyrin repeat-containing protein putative isoform 1 [Tripterygium wilfordii]|uniref:Ankyrin repeat-containing protein putative isoform 1 n=1 Tax=Tripterygium wilfordii TaxID=458696 RepID=A0A7J7D2A1_TRIWF|nr:uncharacterized protein LOC120009934 [Tripterygium wilfordii]KAF5740477.1 Ankyrin repeat-containing protein putative isoform 1 [Tripterygium wilfordii]
MLLTAGLKSLEISLLFHLVFLSSESMAPTYFPLRWESTGDQWWYASPIDWAAANGHYDLVRELLRVDNNHLFKLTSLRRIRRLETVWDDDELFDDVAKCRCDVARKLYKEFDFKKGMNSLVGAGYGGWLLYTAASAGDLCFIQELLQRNPLLVFGEGEFGVTDILYAAARSKNCEVFRIIFDFAVSPRFSAAKGGGWEEQIEEIPSVYKGEMMNRAAHAAARGGNLNALKLLLRDCNDVLAYRDKQGSTILHAAAARGQVEVVKHLIESFDMINSTDNQGNTALHIAAYRGQLKVVEALVLASSSLISLRNNSGETFLHMAVSGFQNPAFRRLDRQIELMRQLLGGKVFNTQDIINAKNNVGRTALHMAIVENVHSELVELLMSAQSINVNIGDADGMTPLDLVRQQPRSKSSDILIRQLISAGGIFGSRDYYTATRAIASQLRMQGNVGSPGTLFRMSDTQLFSHTGIEITSDVIASKESFGKSSSSTEVSQCDSIFENQKPSVSKKSSASQFDSTYEHDSSSFDKKPASGTAARLKSVLHWPRMKDKRKAKKSVDEGSAKVDEGSVKSSHAGSSSHEPPTPLRQRFAKPSSLPKNKRTLSVRSNQSSPIAKKKFASELAHGVLQAMPQLSIPSQSCSSSFSPKSSAALPNLDKQKGVYIDNDAAEPSSSNQQFDDQTPHKIDKQGSAKKRLRNQYFCFGGSAGLSVKTPISSRN